MGVNDRQNRTVLVVHIPKTAGTTLRVLLTQQYAQQPWFVIGHDIQQARRDLAAMPEHERAALRCIFGHMCWGWHEYVPPGRAYAYTTILREPVERVLSLYSHARLKEHYLGPSIGNRDIEWFVTSGVAAQAENGMVRQLSGHDRFLQMPHDDMVIPFGGVTREHLDAAIANLERCALVGVSEDFAGYMARARYAFGWRVSTWRNVNVSKWPRVRLHDLTRRQRAAVEKAIELDIILYQHAKKLAGGT